jgi:hypothetical protein
MKSIEILVHGFERKRKESQDSYSALPQGSASLTSVTIASVHSYVFMHSKPDTFLGDDLKGFSLATVA